jgi:hypothetical protein
MRLAQQNLSQFLSFIHWPSFKRRNLNKQVKISTPAFVPFACGDEEQAIVYLLRQDKLDKKGLISSTAEALPIIVSIPHMKKGNYRLIFWHTQYGEQCRYEVDYNHDEVFNFKMPSVTKDMAIAIVKI